MPDIIITGYQLSTKVFIPLTLMARDHSWHFLKSECQKLCPTMMRKREDGYVTLYRDRIKGLKLQSINTYCGTAAVHKILFQPLCTVACVLRPKQPYTQLPQYTKDKKIFIVPQYTSCSTQGIESIVARVLRYTRHCGAAACRSLPLQLPVQSELCRNLSHFILSPSYLPIFCSDFRQITFMRHNANPYYTVHHFKVFEPSHFLK